MRSNPLRSFQIQPSLRRYLSAGVAGFILVGVIGVPASMLGGYLQRGEEIENLRADVVRLVERSSALGERHATHSSTNAGPAEFLTSSTETAAAHIQATVRDLATTLGTNEVRVESVRVLPPLTAATAIAVRASVSLAAPGPRVFDVVNALEAAKPPIVIDSLRVVSRGDAGSTRGRGSGASGGARSELMLVLRVYARPETGTPGSAKPVSRRVSREEHLP